MNESYCYCYPVVVTVFLTIKLMGRDVGLDSDEYKWLSPKGTTLFLFTSFYDVSFGETVGQTDAIALFCAYRHHHHRLNSPLWALASLFLWIS
jgi:hypothetical protein